MTTQTITVTVCRDAVFEANETFTVTSRARPTPRSSMRTGTGTITNDDTAPTLSINDVTLAEGNAGTTTFTFTVTQTRGYRV